MKGKRPQPTLDSAMVSRCADTAMKAVTRWYAEHLYRDGCTLEEYVRDCVKALATPTKPGS